jgi:uncharacterized DUF497 family protein
LEFEWDEAKAASNIAKHGVSFEIAYDFRWEIALVDADNRFSYGEDRYLAIGKVGVEEWYSIVFTMRGSRLRVISARPSNAKEIGRWQEQNRRS